MRYNAYYDQFNYLFMFVVDDELNYIELFN